MNNTTSNQENVQPDNKMTWEVPVLYKEDWINTLTGTGTEEGVLGLTPTS